MFTNARASLSPYRPKQNMQLRVARAEGEQWHTHFPARPTVPHITSNKRLRRKFVGRALSIHLSDLSVCLCVRKEPLFSWQAAQLGARRPVIYMKFRAWFLDPLAEWKGCLFWLELRLCIQGVETFSGESRAPPWSRATKPHAIFLHSDTERIFVDSLLELLMCLPKPSWVNR